MTQKYTAEMLWMLRLLETELDSLEREAAKLNMVSEQLIRLRKEFQRIKSWL